MATKTHGETISLKFSPMGSGDADTEGDLYDFPNMYVHIDSYDKFVEETTLFIFGKRGVGKTAMIKMLEYEIRNEANGISKRYSLSGRINGQTVLAQQCKALKDIVEVEDRHTQSVTSETLWRLIFEQEVIRVVSNYPLLDKKLKGSIEGYLSANTGKAKSVMGEVINGLQDVKNGKISDAIHIVTKVIANFTPKHQEIYNMCKDYISDKKLKVLIMMDSLDVYDINRKSVPVVIQSLIEITRELTSYTNKVFIKIFFPSELYNELGILNTGKIDSNILHVVWRPKEIITFIALRLNRYLKWVKEHSEFSQEIKNRIHTYDNRIQDLSHKDVLELIYSYFPVQSQTKCNEDFDTIKYLLMHTLLRPRQVITLMNQMILDYQRATKQKKLFPTHDNFSKYLHQGLYKLTTDYFAAYDQLVPVNFGPLSIAIENIFMSQQQPSDICYTQQKMNRNLKRIEPNDAAERKDVLLTLLDIGFLGWLKESELKQHEIRAIESNNNDTTTRIKVHFIYHLEDRRKSSGPSHAKYFFIHPMFYQHIGYNNKNNIFVIPTHVADIDLVEESAQEEL